MTVKRDNPVNRDNSVSRENSPKRDNLVKRDNLLVAGQQISMIIQSMALQAFQNFSEQILVASNHNVHYSDPPVMVCIKLQPLVYHILPSTTAVFSYAIGSRKLSANEQFFVGAQTVVSLLQTIQIDDDELMLNVLRCHLTY